MFTFASALVQLENIGREYGNVRLPNNATDRLAILPLAEDIVDYGGLKTPLTICEKQNLISGNRRYAAIAYIKENKPEVYNRLFGKGIPCVIMEGASVEDLQNAIIDHSNTLQLSNFWELYLCYVKLRNFNATQQTVAVNLNTLMDTVIAPITGKRLAKVKELTAAKIGASDTKAAQLQKEIDEEIAEARHGRVQWLSTIYDAPAIVQRAIFYKYSGEKAEGFESEFTTNRLTESETKKLVAAHNDDMADSETNGKTVSKAVPGVKFTALWEKTLANKNKEGKPVDAKPRRMAVQDIVSVSKDCESKGIRATLSCVLDTDADRVVIKTSDRLLYVAEIVSKHLPEAWQEVENMVANWEAEQNAATDETV